MLENVCVMKNYSEILKKIYVEIVRAFVYNTPNFSYWFILRSNCFQIHVSFRIWHYCWLVFKIWLRLCRHLHSTALVVSTMCFLQGGPWFEYSLRTFISWEFFYQEHLAFQLTVDWTNRRSRHGLPTTWEVWLYILY